MSDDNILQFPEPQKSEEDDEEYSIDCCDQMMHAVLIGPEIQYLECSLCGNWIPAHDGVIVGDDVE